MHTKEDRTSEGTALDGEFTRRSLGIMLAQTRASAVALTLAGPLYGLVIVPRTGWLPWLVWYVTLVASLLLRQRYFMHLVARDGYTGQTLHRVSLWAGVTGLLTAACVPLFVHWLTLTEVAIMTVLTLGQLLVAVIGVKPRMYAVYMAGSLSMVYVGWLVHGTGIHKLVIGLAMVLGGTMMQRAVHTYWKTLRDNAEMGASKAQLVDQLRAALERQHDIQLARSRFLGAASHDLRQPVQALMFLTDIFKRTSDMARREAIAPQIVRTGESIDTMFRHLVDFAQIEAGTLRANLQPVHLGRLIQAIVAGFAEKCAAKGLRFRVDMRSDGAVMADPVLLERVLRNFLDNAAKYSLVGEIVLTVQQSGEDLEISVEDQGVGMDEEDLALVWNSFHRGRSAALAEAEGIGLGLAICRHMADMMGARLGLSSRPGQGTRVTICLPRPAEPVCVARLDDNLRELNLQGRLIAVIEDDGATRRALTSWLQDAGAAVVAGAGLSETQEALLASGRRLDCILADYRLSEGDGVTAIAALRQQHGAVPALILSAEPDLQERGLGLPCLQKPVAPEALMAHLRQLFPDPGRSLESPDRGETSVAV
ncbi:MULTISPECIES: hybrid sensor histidine kinase/response regulator [Ramlibacter]|uniref:histidine kinase n=1 Tax=Ramlibacter pinisoli TaxID=2682844 RepID=A0A6N8IRH2_9BURK|nr:MULTISPECIES: hybrid sensor histidine kinase/response regulator [Ramlibacter]MBA2964356.1 hybrid sensor histidine kinase/response regulator [Ramlibacter sp. CGMCC 1.13660]MVQ29322.1 response regulator [Ramlibacter pinisoli]